ncbi:MAG TPA: hypothetical protein VM911_05460 [Pyrinomonadaceae bacterium]|jgi:hypothetical protein|nr:hypothetical protein [Pyrinomonadaceae bacterium]
MKQTHPSRNRALMRFIVLPMLFLTVALLGGLRVDAETRAFVFVPPPLITLILSVLLLSLFVRAGLIKLNRWISSAHPALENVSHALTLLALFFASAQAFNSVLPERGLLFWLFSLFFLWTLWNNQFSSFDARRLLRSLAVLFGTAFVLKHMLLAALYAPEGGWLKRLAGALLEGVSLGTLDAGNFAPATGYISFFTLALYVGALALMTPAPFADEDEAGLKQFVRAFQKLSPRERAQARAEIGRASVDEAVEAEQVISELTDGELTADALGLPSEETIVARKEKPS